MERIHVRSMFHTVSSVSWKHHSPMAFSICHCDDSAAQRVVSLHGAWSRSVPLFVLLKWGQERFVYGPCSAKHSIFNTAQSNAEEALSLLILEDYAVYDWHPRPNCLSESDRRSIHRAAWRRAGKIMAHKPHGISAVTSNQFPRTSLKY